MNIFLHCLRSRNSRTSNTRVIRIKPFSMHPNPYCLRPKQGIALQGKQQQQTRANAHAAQAHTTLKTCCTRLNSHSGYASSWANCEQRIGLVKHRCDLCVLHLTLSWHINTKSTLLTKRLDFLLLQKKHKSLNYGRNHKCSTKPRKRSSKKI